MCKHLLAAPSRACPPPPWLLTGDHRMPPLSRPAHVCLTPALDNTNDDEDVEPTSAFIITPCQGTRVSSENNILH